MLTSEPSSPPALFLPLYLFLPLLAGPMRGDVGSIHLSTCVTSSVLCVSPLRAQTPTVTTPAILGKHPREASLNLLFVSSQTILLLNSELPEGRKALKKSLN